MSAISLAGRSAIVTGAGHGLGRAHALALAARGAHVLVNDHDLAAASAVAAEIRADGGLASADGHGVEQGERVVDAALAAAGRIDIVVNNAGILRDAAFHKMSRGAWEDVLAVHLAGAFEVTRAAWPHLREQAWGRVIFTSSIAGVHGNFGQANYAAAKLALVGLAQTLAIEGERANIRVNVIAPLAASRLTATVLPPTLLERLDPQLVTPLVVLLASEACPASGQLFEAGGGRFARLRWERSAVVSVPTPAQATAEALLAQWATLQDFRAPTHPASVADGFALVADADLPQEGSHGD